MDQVIRFRSAVALAGRFPVLAGVDLDVARGEVLLLRGANGAGKTSLLRACAGLLRVVAGEALVLGEDLVRDQRAVRRRVGLLGHQTGLYEEMTPADNLRFSQRAARAPASAAAGALELLGISGRLADTRVGALSAGQRRRVAIAALVARDPELWLLDEPHAGLDAEFRDLLDDLVNRAVSRGATVLLASHEADRAAALARRVVTVAGGVVEPAPVDPGSLASAPVGSAPVGSAPVGSAPGGPASADPAPAGPAPAQAAEPDRAEAVVPSVA
jgi:heme ABC exporter ATP-binding subunit CcmA